MLLGLRNSIQIENALKVKESEDWEDRGRVMYKEGESLVGHEFMSDGRYKTEYFRNGLEEVAEFICATHRDKLICNSDDYAIASTIGESLDYCVPSFHKAFFDILIEYQTKRGLLDEDEY